MLSDRDIRERLGPLPETGAEPKSQNAAVNRSLRQWIVGVLGSMGVALWGGGIALILHFESSAPHQPNLQTGQIHRFNDPFSVIYLTARQHTLVESVMIVLPVMTIIIVIGAVATFGRKPPPEN